MNLRITAVLAALALVLAACGDTGDSGGTTDDTSPTTTAGPQVAGVCVEDEPDCEDTVVVGEPLPGAEPIPWDGPNTADGGGATSGFVVDDGLLSVTDALATDATGIIAVKGFIVGGDEGWRLCELLAESFPPQCGGAFLWLENYDENTVAQLPDDERIMIKEAQGVYWTDLQTHLFGEIVDGTLVVDALVTG